MAEAGEFDVLVVGAGPAGLAAAGAAANSGARVCLIDDNPAPGGQIWRGEVRKPSDGDAAAWLDRVRRDGVRWLIGTRVVAASRPGALLAESARGLEELTYRRLVLATGARELFLPFPGWTLPGVMGAGGLQAMAKDGLPIVGRRVVVAGSGPLLLAVAAYLTGAGARVLAVAEQARRRRVLGFGLGLIAQPAKLQQAAALRFALRRVPYLTDAWPTEVRQREDGLEVALRTGRGERRIACDYLACGFGLLANLELPRLLGCVTSGGAVVVDEWQATSVEGIYCAGEPTGVGGLEKALAEGEIAGYVAAGRPERGRALFGRRANARAFAAALDRAFALRAELRGLARADTIVCRCEDVPLELLRTHGSWRSAKLQTRCGMGACQGRVCGSAARFVFGWEEDSARPPLFPVALGDFVAQ